MWLESISLPCFEPYESPKTEFPRKPISVILPLLYRFRIVPGKQNHEKSSLISCRYNDVSQEDTTSLLSSPWRGKDLAPLSSRLFGSEAVCKGSLNAGTFRKGKTCLTANQLSVVRSNLGGKWKALCWILKAAVATSSKVHLVFDRITGSDHIAKKRTITKEKLNMLN